MKNPVSKKKIRKYFELKREALKLMTEGNITDYFRKLYEVELCRLEFRRVASGHSA